METLPFERIRNCLRASLRDREELIARVQQALALPTKKEAEMVVDAVVAALEATLLNNLGTDGFTLKLGSFAKFSVRHEGRLLGSDRPDETAAEDPIRQLGAASPT